MLFTVAELLVLSYVCCMQTVVDLCISCVLITFNKDDYEEEEDDDGDAVTAHHIHVMCSRETSQL